MSADFNGDGKPDLAVSVSAGISVLTGTGNAKTPFITGSTIEVTDAACALTGDLNGDGIPDLLVPVNGTPNAVLTYLGNGDGTFTLKSTTPTPNSGGFVVLADFNNDGKLDFATSANLLALGNGDGTFQTPAPFIASPPYGGFYYIAAGDLNGDGYPDIVLTNPFNVYIYALINNQKGGFTPNIIQPILFSSPSNLVLADVNGDGNLDALIGEIGDEVQIWLGNGQGGLTYLDTLANPAGEPGTIVVADVNGDGIPDILLLEVQTLGILLGEGNAVFEPQIGIGLGPSPANILVANLHGQAAAAGLPDIVAPDYAWGLAVLVNLTK